MLSLNILPLSLFSFKQNAKPSGPTPRRFCRVIGKPLILFTIPSQKIRILSITPPRGFAMICVSGRSEYAFIEHPPFLSFLFQTKHTKPPGPTPRRLCAVYCFDGSSASSRRAMRSARSTAKASSGASTMATPPLNREEGTLSTVATHAAEALIPSSSMEL